MKSNASRLEQAALNDQLMSKHGPADAAAFSFLV